MNHWKRAALNSIREIVFGLEDGSVSTLGSITGIATATGNQSVVIVSGLVIIAVESLSMAAGTYLSNKTQDRAQFLINHKQDSDKNPVKDALFMGISYIIGGSVPILPYLFLSVTFALPISVVAVLCSIFLIGLLSGKLTRTSPVKTAMEMVIVSISAAALGFIVGKLASLLLPGLAQI